MGIRKANAKDIPRIAELFMREYAKEPYNEKWNNKTSIKRIKTYLKENEIFVLEINNEIKGFTIISLYFWDTGLRGQIHEIVVDSNYQGKGFGGRLINFAEEYFKKRGAKRASLFSSDKSKAFKVYKHLGYKEEHFVSLYKKLK